MKPPNNSSICRSNSSRQPSYCRLSFALDGLDVKISALGLPGKPKISQMWDELIKWLLACKNSQPDCINSQRLEHISLMVKHEISWNMMKYHEMNNTDPYRNITNGTFSKALQFKLQPAKFPSPKTFFSGGQPDVLIQTGISENQPLISLPFNSSPRINRSSLRLQRTAHGSNPLRNQRLGSNFDFDQRLQRLGGVFKAATGAGTPVAVLPSICSTSTKRGNVVTRDGMRWLGITMSFRKVFEYVYVCCTCVILCAVWASQTNKSIWSIWTSLHATASCLRSTD